MVLNEGLEVLDMEKPLDDDEKYAAFAWTAISKVVLPSTLKKIGSDTFSRCCQLKNIEFPEGL